MKVERWPRPEETRNKKTTYGSPLPPPPAPKSSTMLAPYRQSFRRELPDVSSRHEVHHRLVALFYGNQLRHLHVSASARFPAHPHSHCLSWCVLLVSTPAAVAEEVFPHLGRRPASAAAPPAFVVLSVLKLLSVCCNRPMSTLQSVKPH